jgi:hypothetical protein
MWAMTNAKQPCMWAMTMENTESTSTSLLISAARTNPRGTDLSTPEMPGAHAAGDPSQTVSLSDAFCWCGGWWQHWCALVWLGGC